MPASPNNSSKSEQDDRKSRPRDIILRKAHQMLEERVGAVGWAFVVARCEGDADGSEHTLKGELATIKALQ